MNFLRILLEFLTTPAINALLSVGVGLELSMRFMLWLHYVHSHEPCWQCEAWLTAGQFTCWKCGCYQL